MKDFVAYPSRPKIALLALGSMGFVLASLWLAGAFGHMPGTDRYHPVYLMTIGWVGVLVFGLFGSIWIGRLFQAWEHLRIGTNGIHHPPWCDQTIPWSEIDDVTTWTSHRQQSLILHLRDRKRFPVRFWVGWLADVNKSITGGDVAISLMGTDRSFDEALSAIEHFRSSGVLKRVDNA